MPISYFTEDVVLPSFKKRIINQWIKNVANNYNKVIGSLSFLFCTDKKILEVNNLYLQHNYYTDIITFDYSVDDIISGDIIISLETVRSNSELYEVNYNEELFRVVIHGILHLCGLDDKTINNKKKMTEAENEALILLDNLLKNPVKGI